MPPRTRHGMVRLTDPYCLHKCLREDSRFSHWHLFEEFDVESFLEITPTHVSFVITKRDDALLQYEVHIRRIDRHALGVNAYCYTFCDTNIHWVGTVEERDYAKFADVHEMIVAQARNAFHTVVSRWEHFPVEEREPWFMRIIRSFEQRCTPDTRARVHAFVRRLRTSLRARRFVRARLLRRALRLWYEWYFDPNNPRGFVKRLRARDSLAHATNCM